MTSYNLGTITTLGPLLLAAAITTSSSLLNPSSFPSQEYVVANREVSIKSVDWMNGEGTMLPLQVYHALRHSCPEVPEHNNNNNNNQKEPLSLESVVANPKKYNISHTAATQLNQLVTLTEIQRAQLLQKIQAEQRASRPVPPSALRILYCDEHICVVDKPSGVLSVPGPRRNPSLANLVYDVLQPDGIHLDQMIAHRLDMATSGILVYALSLRALSQLHSDFNTRRVKKSYQALVHAGHDIIRRAEGEIDVDLERDPFNPPFMRIAQPKEKSKTSDDVLLLEESDDAGVFAKIGMNHKFFRQAPKESLTTWSLVGYETFRGQPVCRLDLHPWTGRTHQLRVHCAQALGAPIVGDEIYGSIAESNQDDRGTLCLHARKLSIYHPISGAPMIFEADTPF
eukprot:scaffold167_cov110-Cylindrotheca_fusiformis.AAC.10